MERATDYFRLRLIEIVAFCNTPSCICDRIARHCRWSINLVRVIAFGRLRFPGKNSTILADGVYLCEFEK